MAKKKTKSRRKANFSYSRPTTMAPAVAITTEAAAAPKPTTDEVVELGVVVADLRQIVKLVAGFVVLELVLWYILQHTGLGPQLYRHL